MQNDTKFMHVCVPRCHAQGEVYILIYNNYCEQWARESRRPLLCCFKGLGFCKASAQHLYIHIYTYKWLLAAKTKFSGSLKCQSKLKAY